MTSYIIFLTEYFKWLDTRPQKLNKRNNIVY